jgi:hypothetical protein
MEGEHCNGGTNNGSKIFGGIPYCRDSGVLKLFAINNSEESELDFVVKKVKTRHVV